MAAPPNAPAEALKSAAERLGRYLHRLPLLTRAVGVGIVGVYLLDVMGAPVAAGFRLDPKVMGLDQSECFFAIPGELRGGRAEGQHWGLEV